MVVPISESSLEYAQWVRGQMRAARLAVDVDTSDRKMQKKVYEAQVAHYNYILVRGSLGVLRLGLVQAEHAHSSCMLR